MEVLFVSGGLYDHIRAEQLAHEADQSAPLPGALRVQSYDPQTHTLVLATAPPVAPQPGDRLIIGPGEMLKRGRMLYAEHCQHCHGVSGDGNGPTAPYLNPLPRDYRQATFKFTSTQTPKRARRDDLARTIEDGIPGTYMPSFKLLKPEESTAIVEYVLWLACRGETELKRYEVLKIDFSEKDARENRAAAQASFADAFENQFPADFDQEATDIASDWQDSQTDDAVVVPASGRTESSPESIARGREIFLSATAKCASCHGEAGKGDGPQTLAVQPDQNGKPRDVPGLFDNWEHPIQPRNLTTGIYRGGRRPVDIYRRIFAGIKGTPMTGFGTALSNEQIWDLVNYVLSIPFEERAPGKGPFVVNKDSGVGIQESGVAHNSPPREPVAGR
jgi:mono/diheme cytochrome c family protein